MKKNEYDFRRFLLAACALALFFCSSTSFGATIRVPYDYAAIQDAINAATDGDIVLVSDGIYRGNCNKNLDFHGKSITLRSENGPCRTIIDCENSGRGFYFHSGETRAGAVEGFTIRNGNVAEEGGGIYLSKSSPSITNSIIRENKSDGDGGGIWADESNAVITGCVISNNVALDDNAQGGGLFFRDSAPFIKNSIISENLASSSGGGVASRDSDISLINSIIWGNGADRGGGLYLKNVYGTRTVLITNCTVANNVAAIYGGGVFGLGTTHALRNTVIWGNTAGSGGDAIYTGDMGAMILVKFCAFSIQPDKIGGSGKVFVSSSISSDPLFEDTSKGNYRLKPDSPCIDAGDNALVPEDVVKDLGGRPRIVDGDRDGKSRVDMGAYEIQIPLRMKNVASNRNY